jgi:hypothetical protein
MLMKLITRLDDKGSPAYRGRKENRMALLESKKLVHNILYHCINCGDPAVLNAGRRDNWCASCAEQVAEEITSDLKQLRT